MNLRNLNGKTIKNAGYYNNANALYIRFTDGTGARFEACPGEEYETIIRTE